MKYEDLDKSFFYSKKKIFLNWNNKFHLSINEKPTSKELKNNFKETLVELLYLIYKAVHSRKQKWLQTVLLEIEKKNGLWSEDDLSASFIGLMIGKVVLSTMTSLDFIGHCPLGFIFLIF